MHYYQTGINTKESTFVKNRTTFHFLGELYDASENPLSAKKCLSVGKTHYFTSNFSVISFWNGRTASVPGEEVRITLDATIRALRMSVLHTHGIEGVLTLRCAGRQLRRFETPFLIDTGDGNLIIWCNFQGEVHSCLPCGKNEEGGEGVENLTT